MCLLLTVGSYGLFETQGELLTSAALSYPISFLLSLLIHKCKIDKRAGQQSCTTYKLRLGVSLKIDLSGNYDKKL